MNKHMKRYIKRKIKRILLGFSMLIIIIGLIGIYYYLIEKDKIKISENFSANLFEYPLPSATKVIDKDCFYGYSFDHLLGSGGYMPIVASMKLTTTLSKEEILNFYKNVELFPYPEGAKKGVELELYFEDEYYLQETKDGYYYRNIGIGSINHISDYFNEDGIQKSVNKIEKSELQYILQLSSAFEKYRTF